MTNSDEGNRLIAERDAAEARLARLDPAAYDRVGNWFDKELYGGLFGHGGGPRLPPEHKSAITAVLRARAAVYRGQKTGTITVDRGRTYDSEVGNEMMAQAIDNCLDWLGDGADLPEGDGRRWDSFLPDGLL